MTKTELGAANKKVQQSLERIEDTSSLLAHKIKASRRSAVAVGEKVKTYGLYLFVASAAITALSFAKRYVAAVRSNTPAE